LEHRISEWVRVLIRSVWDLLDIGRIPPTGISDLLFGDDFMTSTVKWLLVSVSFIALYTTEGENRRQRQSWKARHMKRMGMTMDRCIVMQVIRLGITIEASYATGPDVSIEGSSRIDEGGIRPIGGILVVITVNAVDSGKTTRDRCVFEESNVWHLVVTMFSVGVRVGCHDVGMGSV
jgi:ABC-type xylose transport system permease subunit